MTVEIDLVLGRAVAVSSEDFAFTIAITNRGGAAVTVPHPGLDADEPRIEVRDAAGAVVWEGSRATLEARDSHEYRVVLPPEVIELAPGSTERGDERWARWVPPLGPGEYRVRALMAHGGSELVSTERALTIEALRVAESAFAGPDAGTAELRHALLVHTSTLGPPALLAALHRVDEEGHLVRAQCSRIADVPAGVRIAPSVTQRGLPYPGQWIVWIEGTRLCGLYHMQGALQSTFARPLPYRGTIVGPVLADLEGCDGSRPPRAELLLVSAGMAELFELDPSAQLAAIRSWPLGPGDLEWGAVTFPGHGVRQALLAIRGGDALRVERLAWSADGTSADPETVVSRKGRVLGGGMSVGADDVVRAALVVRVDRDEAPHDYDLVHIALGDGGPSTSKSPLLSDPPLDFVRALVDTNGPHTLAALHAVGDRWLAANEGGVARPIHRPTHAEALGAYLLVPELPALLWATPLGADAIVLAHEHAHPHHHATP